MLPPTYGRNNLFNGRFSTPVQREWRIAMYTMGPLNISNFFQCRLTLPNSMDDQLPEGMFRKARCLTRPTRARQDVPFLGQGRRALGRRGYRRVREHDKRPTCLREAALAKTGNTAGGPYTFARACFFTIPIITRTPC